MGGREDEAVSGVSVVPGVGSDDMRQTAEDYRAIFEATGDGVIIADLEGNLVDINPALCRMHGYSREEMLRLYPTEFIHPSYHDVFAEYLASLNERGSYRTVALDLRKDGSAFPVEINGTVFIYRGQRHVLVVVRDVSDPVPAEEQLKEREEQYRSIFEATGEGLVVGNMQGYVVEANPAYCRMYGYRRDELIGMHMTTLIHPDHIGHIAEAFEAIASRKSYRATGISLRKDGTTFPFEGRGTTFRYKGQQHLLGIVRDVTEQVDAERRLVEAHEYLEQRVEERTRELKTLLEVSRTIASTLEIAPLLNLLLDGLQHVVPYDGAGIRVQEDDHQLDLMRRAPTPAVLPPPDRLEVEDVRPIAETLQGGEVVIIDDVRADTPLARAFRLHAPDLLETRHNYVRCWMGVPMTFKDQWIGMLILCSSHPNLYTRHHADLALAFAQQAAVTIENARLYEKAQELAVLEERQRLSRELHDSVSQVLYSIGLGAQTARALVEHDPARAIEPLDYVVLLAQNGMAEMRGLLFELRPESLESEGLVAALEKHARAVEARHHIPITTMLGNEPDVSLPVKEALYRIAQEALNNAVKHARPTAFELRLCCSGDAILLEVQDNGRGFNPHDPFPGHLGLHSMSERASKHGGTLEIESAPGRGTRVRVYIPVTAGP